MNFDIKNIFLSYKKDFKKYAVLSLIFVLFSILSGILSEKNIQVHSHFIQKVIVSWDF